MTPSEFYTDLKAMLDAGRVYLSSARTLLITAENLDTGLTPAELDTIRGHLDIADTSTLRARRVVTQ